MNDATDTSLPAPRDRNRADRYGPSRPKVPPFARYRGTSAWHKDRRRVRAYARFLAAQKQGGQTASAS